MDYDKLGIEYGHNFTGEVREVLEAGDDIVLKGLAAPFGRWTDLGMFKERIRAGAFADALPTSDVRLLVNHTGLPFARTASGTLDLAESSAGLELTARLSRSDPDVAALVPKIERGDLSQFSFAFNIADDGEEWSKDRRSRTLTRFSEIFDVSLVTFPAYETTKVTSLRTLELLDLRHAKHDVNKTLLREAQLARYARLR